MKVQKRALLALAVFIPAIFNATLTWAHGDEAIDPHMTVENPITAQAQSAGQQGMTKDVTRIIDLTMNDLLRFSPDTLSVKQGETVRFRITNSGKIPHEFVLGTREEILQHAEMMKTMPNMEHASANIVRVMPSKNADIIWQFTQSGRFVYACLIAGHLPAGMEGTVTVVANATDAVNGTTVASSELKKTTDDSATTDTAATDDRYTQGEIRKVDIAQGKLTIKHGDIKNLGMPGMTMVFRVKDPVMVKTVKMGDAVQFVVEIQNGSMVITELKKLP